MLLKKLKNERVINKKGWRFSPALIKLKKYFMVR
jgi:hypothetical protein